MRVAKYKVSSGIHAMNLDNSVHRLLAKNRFIDVTIACDGQKLRCHRLVLAAASPLFEELLMDNPTFHPTVIMPLGLKASTIKTLIDFMYTGEANVTKSGLTELVESAEILQVGGMFDSSTDIREYFVEAEDDDVEEVPKDCDKYFRTFQFKIHHVHEQGTQTDPLITERTEGRQSPLLTAKIKDNIIELIEIEDSVDIPSQSQDDSSISNTANENPESNNESKDSDTAAAVIANDTETILQEANRMKISNTKTGCLKNILSTLPKVDVQESVKQINLLQISPNMNGSKETTKLTSSQTSSKPIPWTYIHIPTVKAQVRPHVMKPSINRPLLPKTTTNATPWTIYQPLPQLGPGQAYIASPIQLTPASALKPTPITSFLKFNSSSMQISVKNLDRTDKQEKLEVVNMALEKENDSTFPQQQATENKSPPFSSTASLSTTEPKGPEELKQSEGPKEPSTESTELSEISLKSEPGDGEITMGSTVIRQADFPMFYAMIKKEQDDLARQVKDSQDDEIAILTAEAETVDTVTPETAAAEDTTDSNAIAAKTASNSPINVTEAEDIICQPSVSYIYDDDDIKDDIECDDDEAGVCIDYDRLVAETYGTEVEEEQQKNETKTKKTPKKRQYKSKKTADTTPSFLLSKPSSIRFKSSTTSVSMSAMSPTQPSEHYLFHQRSTQDNLKINFGKDTSFSDVHKSPKREDHTHSPQTVILRSPRCNQPRHYSTDSLYNALMAVKHGESIYRASRQHAVPRKTLRNWMKRWDIKSKFPMPKQLKDAAKKKKLTISPTI